MSRSSLGRSNKSEGPRGSSGLMVRILRAFGTSCASCAIFFCVSRIEVEVHEIRQAPRMEGNLFKILRQWKNVLTFVSSPKL